MNKDKLESWKELLEEFEASGDTQKSFAAKHDISVGALRYWRGRVRKEMMRNTREMAISENLRIEQAIQTFTDNLTRIGTMVRDLDTRLHAIEESEVFRQIAEILVPFSSENLEQRLDWNSVTFEERAERDLVESLLSDPDFTEPLVLEDFADQLHGLESSLTILQDKLEDTLASDNQGWLSTVHQRLYALERAIESRSHPAAFQRIEKRVTAAQRHGANLVRQPFRSPVSARELCRRLRNSGFLLPENLADEILRHLRVRRLLVLRGAPGTGKSRLASLLPGVLLEKAEGDASTVVPVHPEFSSFDAVGGLRMRDGVFGPHLGYLTDAVLRATEDGGRHWLVFDEINRGDISAILSPVLDALNLESGKLIHDHIFTRSADSRAVIPMPGNFRILGTMNTLDEDQLFRFSEALKRRTGFVNLAPLSSAEESSLANDIVFEPRHDELGRPSGTLRKFKAEYNLDRDSRIILDVVDKIRALTDREPRFLFRYCEIGSSVVFDLLRHLCLLRADGQIGRSKSGVDQVLAQVLLPQFLERDTELLQVIQQEVFQGSSFPYCSKLLAQRIDEAQAF